jgi:hypothetical protein
MDRRTGVPHAGAMAETKRYRLREQTWSFGTLLGGVLLGLLIGLCGVAATMALVADEGSSGDNAGREHPGRGNSFGLDKQHDRGKSDERGRGQDRAKERAGGKQGMKMGLENGNGPDGQGPPGLLKKR